ncbi:hypothetical protein HDV05_008822, partial [Chytridiales sp. JEL 0842]
MDSQWNERRQMERNLFGLQRGDIMHFLSASFVIEWRYFLLGNSPPPQSIDNSMLVLPVTHPIHVAAAAATDDAWWGTQRPLLNPTLTPLQHFAIVSP